jgi:hypothetical protein
MMLGNLFGIDEPTSHPVTVVAILGAIGFILSLGVHWLFPKRQGPRPAPTQQTSPTTPPERPSTASQSSASRPATPASPASAA